MPVDVEAEDALDLLDDDGAGRIAVDRAVNLAGGVLPQADADRCPVAIRQECQVEVALRLAAFGWRSMPRPYEIRALFERVPAPRLDAEDS